MLCALVTLSHLKRSTKLGILPNSRSTKNDPQVGLFKIIVRPFHLLSVKKIYSTQNCVSEHVYYFLLCVLIMHA